MSSRQVYRENEFGQGIEGFVDVPYFPENLTEMKWAWGEIISMMVEHEAATSKICSVAAFLSDLEPESRVYREKVGGNGWWN